MGDPIELILEPVLTARGPITSVQEVNDDYLKLIYQAPDCKWSIFSFTNGVLR